MLSTLFSILYSINVDDRIVFHVQAVHTTSTIFKNHHKTSKSPLSHNYNFIAFRFIIYQIVTIHAIIPYNWAVKWLSMVVLELSHQYILSPLSLTGWHSILTSSKRKNIQNDIQFVAPITVTWIQNRVPMSVPISRCHLSGATGGTAASSSTIASKEASACATSSITFFAPNPSRDARRRTRLTRRRRKRRRWEGGSESLKKHNKNMRKKNDNKIMGSIGVERVDMTHGRCSLWG